jgi:ubiquinone/menaquinone biosynthesis C-methylase UbiE
MQEQFDQLVPESKIYRESRDIATPASDKEFDYIFCCEVLEHLTPKQTENAFSEFKRLGGTKTIFVIEVPIEIGLFGAIKNIYRRVISRTYIPWSLIYKSLIGGHVVRQPRMTASGYETFEHPGYSFKTTKEDLSKFMDIESEFNDPFRNASFIVNNSHIFVSRLKHPDSEV